MTKPAGTEESAAFSIPTINPSDCKSLSACACSLPVKSGISTNVGAPPSTGRPSKTFDNAQTVPNTSATEIIRAGKVNLNFIFGLVKSTRFSWVWLICICFLCCNSKALKSSADLNLSEGLFSRSFNIAFSSAFGMSFL